jgi:hypothetical protein
MGVLCVGIGTGLCGLPRTRILGTRVNKALAESAKPLRLALWGPLSRP